MTIEDIQEICGRYPGVTQDLKWTDQLCFCVGGKMFLIIAPDEVPCPASVKVRKEHFVEILEQDGFRPAPYLARHGWVRMDDICRLPCAEWETWIDNAYRLVAARLPSKARRDLGL